MTTVYHRSSTNQTALPTPRYDAESELHDFVT
jgi:hypothetical protein